MAKKGPKKIAKKGLSQKQKEKLAEFCGNLAVAWLAAGVIGPYISKEELAFATQSTFFSIFLAGVLITFMLSLVKEKVK